MSKPLFCCILLLLFLDLARADCKTNFECTSNIIGLSEFCTQACELRPICDDSSIDTQCDDGEFMHLYDNPKDFCNCCRPKCIKYQKEDDACEPVVSDKIPHEMCGPQLACIQHKCKPMVTDCMEEARRVLEKPGMNQRPPECDDDGYYKPVQCTSSNGLCRCVEKETGIPISSGGLESGVVQAKASDMDCLCAQNYHKAIKQGCLLSIDYSDYTNDEEYRNDVIGCVEESSQSSMYNDITFFGEFGQMRCQPNGNYDPIQCVQQPGSNGLCFCIDTKSVTLDTNYTSGNFKQLDTVDTLPCFDKENKFHNSKHYRPCEMEAKSIYDLKTSYLEEGDQTYIHGEIPPICSSDGFYAKLQVNKQNINQRYCSGRNGEVIEEFLGSLDSLSGRNMNCECALSRHYLLNSKPKCCANGNFKPMQCVGGLCYCVDQYGRQFGEEIEQTKSDQLPCSESHIDYKKNDFCCELEPYSIGDWCFAS